MMLDTIERFKSQSKIQCLSLKSSRGDRETLAYSLHLLFYPSFSVLNSGYKVLKSRYEPLLRSVSLMLYTIKFNLGQMAPLLCSYRKPIFVINKAPYIITGL